MRPSPSVLRFVIFGILSRHAFDIESLAEVVTETDEQAAAQLSPTSSQEFPQLPAPISSSAGIPGKHLQQNEKTGQF